MNDGVFVRVPGSRYLAWWCERFGCKQEVFDGLACYQRGKSSIWIGAAGVRLDGLRPVDGVGVPFLRVDRHVWKPAHPAAIEFAHRATRGVVDLDRDGAGRFLRGDPVPRVPDAGLPDGDRGYVLVRAFGVGIGCGRILDATLESSLPKARRLDAVDLPQGFGGIEGPVSPRPGG